MYNMCLYCLELCMQTHAHMHSCHATHVYVQDDARLQEITQQVSLYIESRCDGCRPVISMQAFRCFPESLSAVTYRAQLHEIPETDLRLIIEDLVKDGRPVVVQSLVLQINSSCPVFVSGVNDDECHLPVVGSPSPEPSSIAVIVGGAVGGTIGVILVIGVVIIVITKVIARHRQAMAKMQNEGRYLDYTTP